MRPSNARFLQKMHRRPTKANTKIRAAIFDFDGTLADTETHAEDCLSKAVKLQKELNLSDEQYHRVSTYCYGRSLHAILDFMSNEFALDHQQLCADYSQLWQQALDATMAIDHSVECAKQLHHQGLSLSICSGSEHHQIHTLLELIGIRPLFSHLVSAEHYPAAFGKPHARPFELTLIEHQIEPSEAVVFEDSLNGVTSAKAANIGIIIALCNDADYAKQLSDAGADLVTPSLHHDDVYHLIS